MSIQIPLTSRVADVRPNAVANGRASLYFFLTAILGAAVTPEVCQFLQVPIGKPVSLLIPKMRLRSFASDFILWNSIQPTPKRVAVLGIPFDASEIPIPEPFRWLYGRVQVAPVIDWAPDIILTSNMKEALGPALEMK